MKYKFFAQNVDLFITSMNTQVKYLSQIDHD
ncbi:hypothetical protein NIES3974_17630 [Calothrix sp. NIES-3974]|nr:hypothetical protein NIES3974_17630 [Calothrix sp. NIES-3974]